MVSILPSASYRNWHRMHIVFRLRSINKGQRSRLPHIHYADAGSHRRGISGQQKLLLSIDHRHRMHVDLRLRSNNTGLRGRSPHIHHVDAGGHRSGTSGQHKLLFHIGLGFSSSDCSSSSPETGLGGKLLNYSNEQRQKSWMHFYRGRCRLRIPRAYLSEVPRGSRYNGAKPLPGSHIVDTICIDYRL